MTRTCESRFPSPFEVPAPPGCEGWEKFYPYYHTFREERRAFDDGKFWFFDGMHHPEPLYPFDAIICEAHWVALSQFTTRVFLIPPALGIDQRILNGYLYMSPNAITDPETVAARAEIFEKRAGYYFENWDALYEKWQKKAEAQIRALEAIEVPELPEIEGDAVVTEGRGITQAYALLKAYHRVIENVLVMWSYHFEMLNLGYVAYLTFMEFCRKAFPGISDQAMAKMVAGVDILLFKPDDELKKLAKLAVTSGLTSIFKSQLTPCEVLDRMKATEPGRLWLDALETAKQPWFNFSSGTGFYHDHRSWIDDLSVPFEAIRGYVTKIENGESIERPLEANRRERERIASEYVDLLDTPEDRKTFEDLLGLVKTVFPYVENHNFFVEHWHHTVFWNKIREFGGLLKSKGFLGEPDDIFYLNRYEIEASLFDLLTGWAVGTPACGPEKWPQEVARRRKILDGLKQWSPLPTLGKPPEMVTDPFTIMLWGITTERVQEWLNPEDAEDGVKKLKGCAASPGVVEGMVRVIKRVDQLDEVESGEILVCPITSPSWAPVFSKIQAAVSDIGGIMCHAAIVSREYGLPAVVGTGRGTKVLETGQRVRVDGHTGLVSVIA